MARVSVSYICQQCGSTFPKWAGKCDDCGAWNTLVEERKDATAGPSKQAVGRRVALEPLQSAKAAALLPRMQSDISEFDRVAGEVGAEHFRRRSRGIRRGLLHRAHFSRLVLTRVRLSLSRKKSNNN